MPTATIYNWIYRGGITAHYAPGTRNWIITAEGEQMRQLRERRTRPPGYYTRARWAQPEQQPDARSLWGRSRCPLTGSSTGARLIIGGRIGPRQAPMPTGPYGDH